MNECSLIIFAAPKELFTEEEFEALRIFLNKGGSIAVFMENGGRETNLNSFLEEYGLTAETDNVIRTSYYKYFHPKHVFIANGILHPNLNRAKRKVSKTDSIPTYESMHNTDTADCCLYNDRLNFVYPNGTIINTELPAFPILSSGAVAYPSNQAIAAISNLENTKDGKIFLVASADIFNDEWIDCEDNRLLADAIFDFLLNVDQRQLDRALVDTSSLECKRAVPSIASLANRLKVCVQEESPLPQDLMSLYDDKQFGFDTSYIPEVLTLYEALNIPHKPLTLIKPEFEKPIPQLRLATFKPRMRDLPPPALDLYDLDEDFADNATRLTQLAIKCREKDNINFFIKEANKLVGAATVSDISDSKAILGMIFKKVSCAKKFFQSSLHACILQNLLMSILFFKNYKLLVYKMSQQP